MKSLVFPAKIDRLHDMLEFIEEPARCLGFDEKKLNQIRLSSEEIIVNIINYAYLKKNGDIQISYRTTDNKSLEVEIVDWGVSFNPLNQEAPDVGASLQERRVGGLGIYLALKIIDKIDYKREGGRNILTFVKN